MDDHFFHSHAGDVRGRPPETCVVLPGLLVGEYPRIEDVGALKRDLGVTAVVSFQDDVDLVAKGVRLERLRAAYAELGIEFVRVPVAENDVEGLATALPGALATLRALVESGHTVLVHCNAGYNRAPTLVVAYLHTHHSMSLDEACRFLKGKRPCVPFMTLLRAHFRRTGV